MRQSNYGIPGMDRFYFQKYSERAAKELEYRYDLKNLLGGNINIFLKWVGPFRLDYASEGIEADVTQFIEEIDRIKKRMHTTNVKAWYILIKKVFARDNYTCTYCGKVGGKLEADHVIPFSRDGDDSLENLVTACRKCNRQKKDKTLLEFILWKNKKEALAQ